MPNIVKPVSGFFYLVYTKAGFLEEEGLEEDWLKKQMNGQMTCKY
jgi:hypothetical protein